VINIIHIGTTNKLNIKNFTQFGAYLDADTGERQDNVLLPVKQVPEGAEVGDLLEVFIYRDSENRLIATTRKPLAQVGDLAYLKATAATKIGGFLDLGLERGLFLPFSEQKYPIKVGKSYLVFVYLDKSGRLSCTTDVYKHLSSDHTYSKDVKVSGTVYQVKPEFGAFVAVENKYLGLIPSSEVYTELNPGDQVEARVIRVREDGKLDLSLRDLSHLQMDRDAETLLKGMRENYGLLSLNENATPQEIEIRFQMSKAAFKRAIGRLLRTRTIVKTKDGLRLS